MPDRPGNLVFLGRAQRKLMARGNAIFMYHKIGVPRKNTCDPFLYTEPQEFERQLADLQRLDFRPAKLDDLLPSTGASCRNFVVTFDDGFRNVFELGLEVLARRRIPAVQFIVSSFIGKQNDWDVAKGDVPELLMDAAQIKEWLAAGHELGSHSASHRNLKTLSAADVMEEVFSSKKFLEDKFNVPIRHFSYPFGGWTPEVQEQVISAGYKTACGVEFGVNPPGTDSFALRRIIPLSRLDLYRKIVHRLARKAGFFR